MDNAEKVLAGTRTSKRHYVLVLLAALVFGELRADARKHDGEVPTRSRATGEQAPVRQSAAEPTVNSAPSNT